MVDLLLDTGLPMAGAQAQLIGFVPRSDIRRAVTNEPPL